MVGTPVGASILAIDLGFPDRNTVHNVRLVVVLGMGNADSNHNTDYEA